MAHTTLPSRASTKEGMKRCPRGDNPEAARGGEASGQSLCAQSGHFCAFISNAQTEVITRTEYPSAKNCGRY